MARFADGSSRSAFLSRLAVTLLFLSSRVVVVTGATTTTTGAGTRSRRSAAAFVTPSSSRRVVSRPRAPLDRVAPPPTTPGAPSTLLRPRSSSSTRLYFGDSGFFGIGAPEVAVIALVGYFVLGPTELYKLTKEIGKFIQSIRTLGTEASKTFEEGMENQLQLTEIRKAQRELTDAFSFRRSINVVDEEVPFEDRPNPEVGMAAAAAAGGGEDAATPTKTKKVRRRIKKRAPVAEEPAAAAASPVTPNIPDLSMPAAVSEDQKMEQRMEQLAAQMEQQRRQNTGNDNADADAVTDWFDASDETVAEKVLSQQPLDSDAQSRFAAQLSGDWNARVLENEEALSPLAMIMERLSILEEEKTAADARLEEEFRLRGDLEEKYYREKRGILEEAALQVQTRAYGDVLQREEEEVVAGNVTVANNGTEVNVTDGEAVAGAKMT